MSRYGGVARPLAAILVVALALVIPASTSGAALPSPLARAWIDAPLPGTAVPPEGSVEVVVHATDPAGVSRIQLLLAQEVLDEVALRDGGRLVTARLRWTADREGELVLEVRAEGPNGWGESAWLLIVVGLEPSPDASLTPGASTSASAGPSAGPTAGASADASAGASTTAGPGAGPTARPTARPTTPAPTPRPTPAPTPRPTPIPTPRPTPPPCTPIAPDLLAPSNGFVITDTSGNPPTLRWDYRTGTGPCPPSGFRVQVATEGGFARPIHTVDLGPDARSWTPPARLDNCATYAWRVIPKRSDGSLGPSTVAWTFEVSVRCAP